MSSLQRYIILKAQLARNIAQSYRVAPCVCACVFCTVENTHLLSLHMLLSPSLVLHGNKRQLPQRPDVPFYVAGCLTWGMSCLGPPTPTLIPTSLPTEVAC